MGDSKALNNAHGSPFARVAVHVENRVPAPTYWQAPAFARNPRGSARQAPAFGRNPRASARQPKTS
jgi:hypothetical protein